MSNIKKMMKNIKQKDYY